MAGDSHRAKGQRRPVESSSRCHRANAAAARGDLGELKSIATHRQYLMNIERYVKNPIARLWCVVNEDLEGKIAEDAFRRLKDLFDFYLMWDDEVRDLLVESMLRLQFDGVEHFFLPEWQVELIHNADIDDDDYNLILSRYKNLNQKEHRDEARRWWNTQLQSIMQVVDESVCGQVADNVYKQLCEELKAVHDIVN